MQRWKCITFLPDGSTCNRPAVILDSQRGGMICERCARADEQLGGDGATAAFLRAKQAVEASPLLRAYARVLLGDWTRDDSFWNWILTSRNEDVISWAKTAVPTWPQEK